RIRHCENSPALPAFANHPARIAPGQRVLEIVAVRQRSFQSLVGKLLRQNAREPEAKLTPRYVIRCPLVVFAEKFESPRMTRAKSPDSQRKPLLGARADRQDAVRSAVFVQRESKDGLRR